MNNNIKGATVGVVAIVLLATVLALPALAASVDIEEGFYTVAWEMPSNGDKWPQTLHAYEYTGEARDLDLLDHLLAECTRYQVDIYKIDSERDVTTLAWLIKKGTLGLNDDGKPEDNKIWHSSKITVEADCGTTTTSSTTSSSSTTSTVPGSTTTTAQASTNTSVEGSTSTTLTDGSTPDVVKLTELPFTGVPLILLAAVGLGLLSTGGFLVWRTRS